MSQVMSSFDIDSEPFTWTKAANAVNSCVSRDSADPSSKNVASNDMSILTDLLSVNGIIHENSNLYALQHAFIFLTLSSIWASRF